MKTALLAKPTANTARISRELPEKGLVERMPDKPPQRSLVNKINKLMEKLEPGWEERFGLTETERRVLKTYVSDPNIDIPRAAAAMDMNPATMAKATRSIYDLLAGNGRDYPRRKKYIPMTNEELFEIIARNNITTRSQIWEYNTGLGFEMERRGIIDILPRNYNNKTTFTKKDQEILELYERLYKTKMGIKRISTLPQIEAEFLLQRVLAYTPLSMKKFEEGQETECNGHVIRRHLIKRLQGKPVLAQTNNEVFEELRSLCKRIGKEQVDSWKSRMSAFEIRIIDSRIFADNPISLASLGREKKITREMARQEEKKLLEKMRTWETGKELPERKPGKKITQIKTVVEAMLDQGINREEIDKRLTPTEQRVLTDYILAEPPITGVKAEKKLGLDRPIGYRVARIYNELIGKNVPSSQPSLLLR